MSPERRNALLLLHITVLIWGFTGVLGRLITLEAEALVWYRTLIGVLGLVVASYILRFSISWPRRHIMEYLITGTVIAVHWVTFFGAIKASTISVTLTCLSSTTVFVALLEPLWYKRRIRPYELLIGLVVFGAILLIFQLETEYRKGIVLAMISALGAAIFTVLNGKQVERDDAKRIALYELGGAWAMLGVYMLASGTPLPLPQTLVLGDVFWLLILGLVCTSFAFVVGIAVMRQLSPFTVALTVNLEPVYGIILALLFFGESEHLKPGSYAGAGIILACLFFNGWLQRRERRKAARQALPVT